MNDTNDMNDMNIYRQYKRAACKLNYQRNKYKYKKKIICECGLEICLYSKYKHIQSERHYINMLHK